MESDSCNFSFITYVLPNQLDRLKKLRKTVKEIKRSLNKELISSEWVIIVDGDCHQIKDNIADKIIHNNSLKGYILSKNEALDELSGEWLLSLDINDSIHKNFISYLKKICEQENEVMWMYSTKEIDESKVISKNRLYEICFKNNDIYSHSKNIAIKKEALKNPYTKGWLNIPSHEDVGTLLAISELYSGAISRLRFVDNNTDLSNSEEKVRLLNLNKPFSLDKISKVVNKIRKNKNIINLNTEKMVS